MMHYKYLRIFHLRTICNWYDSSPCLTFPFLCNIQHYEEQIFYYEDAYCRRAPSAYVSDGLPTNGYCQEKCDQKKKSPHERKACAKKRIGRNPRGRPRYETNSSSLPVDEHGFT
jgi:hypothetical protein